MPRNIYETPGVPEIYENLENRSREWIERELRENEEWLAGAMGLMNDPDKGRQVMQATINIEVLRAALYRK